MVDYHNKTFFGDNSAFIVQSGSRIDPATFFKLFKKKEDETWERPSEGEGITIKFAMKEVAMILEVLQGKLKSWSTKHSFKKRATIIVVEWSSDTTFMINTANYSITLKSGQIQIFQMLLQHILEEKVIYATSGEHSENQANVGKELPAPQNRTNKVKKYPQTQPKTKKKPKRNKSENDRKNMNAIIEGETEKALLLNFEGKEPTWIPKSTIHSEFQTEKGIEQNFLIEVWVLKKNNIV
ncbi:MAG: hypothetical protein BAJALOKI2v1_430013 [Promethearchaeota archaeon]|nr:MAG: hypothetical protein BAJALOKI2v1_430013 [Candidatus Lokiarchaeota archaeon]